MYRLFHDTQFCCIDYHDDTPFCCMGTTMVIRLWRWYYTFRCICYYRWNSLLLYRLWRWYSILWNCLSRWYSLLLHGDYYGDVTMTLILPFVVSAITSDTHVVSAFTMILPYRDSPFVASATLSSCCIGYDDNTHFVVDMYTITCVTRLSLMNNKVPNSVAACCFVLFHNCLLLFLLPSSLIPSLFTASSWW